VGGSAGPVAAGLKVVSGRVQNPDHIRCDQGGKGVKTDDIFVAPGHYRVHGPSPWVGPSAPTFTGTRPVQKVRHNVERQPQACIVRRTLKDLDGRHQRHGQRGCVKVPSLEMAHTSATEGTERGRRGGMSPAWGSSERGLEDP